MNTEPATKPVMTEQRNTIRLVEAGQRVVVELEKGKCEVSVTVPVGSSVNVKTEPE